jgi:hypothetical protein
MFSLICEIQIFKKTKQNSSVKLMSVWRGTAEVRRDRRG